MATRTKEELEHIARQIAHDLKKHCPPDVGFVALTFDLGSGGTVSYMSSAKRTDMIRALRELILNLEKHHS